MENISPVIFFIIYLAITAWAKQRKAQAKKAAGSPIQAPARPVKRAPAKPAPAAGPGFFEQIKKELMELQEQQQNIQPPLILQREPEPVVIKPVPEILVQQNQEGSGAIREYRRETEEHMKIPTRDTDHQAVWNRILEPYSIIERGIILKEVLGDPRALQSLDKWVHR